MDIEKKKERKREVEANTIPSGNTCYEWREKKKKKKKENGRFFHRDILVSIYRQKLVHVEIKTLQNCKEYKNLKKNMVSRNQKFFIVRRRDTNIHSCALKRAEKSFY